MSCIKNIFSKIAWIVTALGSINWGLKALGFDLFSLDFMRTSLSSLEMPVYYFIGLAGVYSLISFFTHCGANCEA